MPNTTDQRRIDGDSVCSGSCKLNGPRQCVLCFEEQPGHELAGRQDVVDECDRLSGERGGARDRRRHETAAAAVAAARAGVLSTVEPPDVSPDQPTAPDAASGLTAKLS